MNEFLDNLYGTSDRMNDEQEKLAQAQVLDEVLTNNGIDINDLNGEELLKVAMEVFDEGSEIVKVAAEAAAEEGYGYSANGDMDKLAEADFAGRVMAHAYADEMDKLADGKWEAAKKGVTSGFNKAKSFLGKPGADYKYLRDGGKGLSRVKSLGMAAMDNKAATGAMAAGGLAAAGGLGYGAKKAFGGKEKQSSALDAMVEARAIEILESL